MFYLLNEKDLSDSSEDTTFRAASNYKPENSGYQQRRISETIILKYFVTSSGAKLSNRLS